MAKGPLGQFWGWLTGSAKAASAASALAVTAPAKGELGMSGTANFSGEVIGESNLKLLHERAYGSPGVRTWGEWEKARRTDEAVAKSINHVLGPIRDSRVDVEEAEENPNGAAHAEFIRWVISNVSPGWSEYLTQSCGGSLMSGFALHEEVWGQVQHKSLPGGQGIAITKLAERLPGSVRPNGWKEVDGELSVIQQLGPKGTEWKFVDLPATKVLLNSWDRSGNNYLGYSAYRSVWYLIQIRAELARIIGVSHVREAAGIPIAVSQDKDAPELGPDERATLEKFLRNCVYHENSNVIMPRGWDLKWLFAPSTSRSAVIEAYNHLGLLVMSQVGAQQLNLGTGATGSRSVGQVHDATSIAYIQGVLSHQQDLLNGVSGRPYTGWVRKQIDLNWGPQPSYPLIKLSLRKPQLQPLDRFTAAKAAKEAGIISVWTRDDENVAREELGFAPAEAESDEKEPLDVDPAAKVAVDGAPAAGGEKAQDTALNGAQVVAAQAIVMDVGSKRLDRASGLAMLKYFFNLEPTQAEEIIGEMGKGFKPTEPPPPPAPFGGGPPKAPVDDAGSDGTAQPPEPAVAASSGFVPRRPLRASEQHLDLTSMAAALDGARDQFANGVRPLVAELLMRALPEVKLAMADGDPSEVSTLQLDTERLEAFVGKYLEQLRAEGFRQVASEKRRAAPPSLKGAAGEEDDKYTTEPDAAASDDAQAVLVPMRKHLVRKMANRLLSDLEKEAIDVIRTGGDPEEVVTRTLENQATTGAFKSDAGIVTTKAWSIGRGEFFEKYGDQVEAMELSAILDNATCGPCEQLDGTQVELGSAEYEELTPPLSSRCNGGDSCRCLYAAIWKKPGEEDA